MGFLDDLSNANDERNKEWDPHNKLTPMFFAVELAGEVGELCNVIKKLEREALGLPGSRATNEQLEDEIADVLIVLSLLANILDVDLETVTRRKFNATSDKLNLEARI
jgi:NTP pyrophosphatase (non-canonical NTP hydrolase)